MNFLWGLEYIRNPGMEGISPENMDSLIMLALEKSFYM